MRNWHRWLLAGIVFCAIGLRYGGFDRPINMHPDQPRIVSWMNRVDEDGYLKNVVYPGGFFTLFKYFKIGAGTMVRLEQQWEYFSGQIDRTGTPRDINLVLGRHFNVWLAGLTCILVYLLATTISKSPAVGLFSALLLCFTPEHIIHSHYVQTDIAMVFTLTLTLWLWTLFARRRTWWLFAAAALAAGFAAGTKYTLVCLAPLGLFFSFYPAADPERRNWRRIPLFIIASLLFLALGFILANPAVLNWQFFRAGLQWQGARVYGEGVTLMGQARGEPFLRIRSHWLMFHQQLTALGPGFLAAAGLGLIAACMRPWRRFWPVLIGFPAVYFYYYIFKSPWVRTQEFMAFFPVFFTLAGLGLMLLWNNKTRLPGKPAALLLGIICLAPILRLGLMADSQFKWKDTRHLANRWLQLHLPYESSMGMERYTTPAQVNASQDAEFIYKIEVAGSNLFENGKFNYVMRNPNTGGRGIMHPITGERYPNYQANFDYFTNRATLLYTWGALPPDSFKHPFSSSDQELWGLAQFIPELELHLPLTQPFSISRAGRETFFPASNKTGGAELLLIDKHTRQFAFGGPEELNRPVFAIVNTLERPTDFRLRGFGRRFNVQLAPYEAAALPLQRPAWRPRLKLFEVITASTKPVPHILQVPCLLRPAFDPYEAALLLRQNGHHRQALNLLQTYPPPQNTEYAAALIYPLAVHLKEWDLAEKWMEPAQTLHARLDQALELPPEELLINGISGYFHNQLARIRITPPHTLFNIAMQPEEQAIPEDNPALPPGFTMEIPARIARGLYNVTAEIRPLPCQKDKKQAGLFSVYDHYGTILSQGAWQALPTDFFPVTFTLRAGREVDALLHFTSTTKCTLEYRNLEVRWNIHAQIRAIHNELTAARAAHDLYQGQPDRALAIIAQSAAPAWNELELQRLQLAALQAAQAPTEYIADTARDLLGSSPRYFPALRIINPQNAQDLEGNIQQPLRFPPFLALIAAHTTSSAPGSEDRQTVILVFEALADDIPPLAAVLHTRRRRGWRTSAHQSLQPIGTQNLQRGERVRVVFEPDQYSNALKTTPKPADFGVSVRSDVRWSPGTIKPENRDEPVMPLTDIVITNIQSR